MTQGEDVEFVFEPPRVGMWDRRSPGNHEAAHAVTAIFLDFEVLECRIDGDLDGGITRLKPGVAVTRPRDALLILMAGPKIDMRPIPWPPQRGCGGDEDMSALLVDRLGVDADEWREREEFLHTLFGVRSVKRALAAVSGALFERGALTGADVRHIYNEASNYQS